tara:strand:+ start:1050 stop:1484 length:435 start_codon:yes stop_codon:yes gene_type:complete
MLNKILLSIVLLMPSLAYAENGRFTYLEPGMPAPFKGTLFDDSATAHLLTLPEYYQLQCDLELEYQLGLQQEKFNFQLSDLNSQVKFLETENISITNQYNTRIELLEEQVKRNNRNDRPWYIAAGVAIGVGLTIGIMKASEANQ